MQPVVSPIRKISTKSDGVLTRLMISQTTSSATRPSPTAVVTLTGILVVRGRRRASVAIGLCGKRDGGGRTGLPRYVLFLVR